MSQFRDTAQTRSDGGRTFDDWAELRPEIRVPGYWDNLTENCEQWASEVSVCPLWKAFDKHRPAWRTEFHQQTGGALLVSDELPQFCGKKHKRIQTKLRQLETGKAPKKAADMWPSEGPPVPRLHDLVRTRVKCQFLDGVEFIATKLEQLATDMDLHYERERQGRIEGYFAQHLYFTHDVIYRFGGVSQQVTISCEVQFATLLASRVWEESHAVYEVWRGREESQDEWQWNPKEPRFLARQLGHMIHLADGLLVQLRDAPPCERIER